MQLSSPNSQLKFEATADKVTLEEVIDGKNPDVPINTLYYVELLTDIAEDEKYPVQYATDDNHKLLRRYGYAPSYPAPLQSSSHKFFFDGVLRGFVSNDGKKTIGFRVWTRSDLRISERYTDVCQNKWDGLY